jgi:hypothetical protein
MIRQSRIIRDVILKIPNELIEASGQPNSTGPETTIGESIPENHTLTAVADTIDATTVATANDGNDVADTIENAGGAYVLHDNDDDSDDIFYDASTNIIMGENEVTSDEAQPETPNISESPSFPSKNRDLDAIATTTGDGDVADTIATTDGDDGVADTIDNTSDDVYAFQDHGGVYVLHDDDSDSNDILYDASDNTDSTMAENEVTPNDAQPETPNISESPSSPSKKRNLDAIDDESDSTSDDSKVAKKAKIMEDTVPPDDMEIDGPTVSDSTNNQQTPQLSPQLPSPSISPAIHNQEPETPTVSPTRSPTRTVEEYMESGIPNPYISNRNRYKT